MARKLKYVVASPENKVAHHSYTKQKANEWIKKFGDKRVHRVEKL